MIWGLVLVIRASGDEGRRMQEQVINIKRQGTAPQQNHYYLSIVQRTPSRVQQMLLLDLSLIQDIESTGQKTNSIIVNRFFSFCQWGPDLSHCKWRQEGKRRNWIFGVANCISGSGFSLYRILCKTCFVSGKTKPNMAVCLFPPSRSALIVHTRMYISCRIDQRNNKNKYSVVSQLR